MDNYNQEPTNHIINIHHYTENKVNTTPLINEQNEIIRPPYLPKLNPLQDFNNKYNNENENFTIKIDSQQISSSNHNSNYNLPNECNSTSPTIYRSFQKLYNKSLNKSYYQNSQVNNEKVSNSMHSSVPLEPDFNSVILEEYPNGDCVYSPIPVVNNQPNSASELLDFHVNTPPSNNGFLQNYMGYFRSKKSNDPPSMV